ncbi:unnamed protein product [Ilex paraguariensis]|uniref:Late embryogenesis abundant protein LEA-2 subgroup domain-containing protein n=1 Tax=Ilex paraguariensis TaxID=185542 RepID=A0ABC8RGQ7_9AQUA
MPEPSSKSSRKSLAICCGVTTAVLTILVIVCVILLLTVFKPKRPHVTAHPASLENIQFQLDPSLSLNATLGLVVTIHNRNYGSFKYQNTTSTIDYHGITVADVPIEGDKVPARGTLNISRFENFTADKLILSPYFWDDLRAGSFNLTSTATLHGKVCVFEVFKVGATVFTTCDISVFIQPPNVESKCNSYVKL